MATLELFLPVEKFLNVILFPFLFQPEDYNSIEIHEMQRQISTVQTAYCHGI